MFFMLTIYAFMVLVIFWSYCGYLIFLYLFSLFSEEDVDPRQEDLSELPLVHIVVPFYNERDMIKAKVLNLAENNYPTEKLRVTFVDGQSTDGSTQILRELLENKPDWELIVSPAAGKIAQLNHFLALYPDSEFVLCTDVDAMLQPDTIGKLSRKLNGNPAIGLVGAHIIPKGCLELDGNFWCDQNNVRFFESKVHSSSIVVAPCYLFRRCILVSFPEDCVADDVYLSFKANSENWLVKQVKDAYGYEIRCPKSLDDYFRHKFRKAHAYIIELLRFFYIYSCFSSFFKVVYATKIFQLLICPWLIFYFILSTISLFLSGGGWREMALMANLFLLVSFILAGGIMRRGRQIFVDPRGLPYKKRMLLLSFFINNFILLWVGICFPFYRQNSRYQKCRAQAS